MIYFFGHNNTSTVKLEINGKLSSGKRTRHIKIRFFFIKDRIKSGDINIVYCPTDRMLADFLTKPLQGNTFKIFRDQLMNYSKPFNVLGGDNSSSTLKECVGTVPNSTKHKQCLVGYAGPLCLTCAKDYVNTGNECFPCPGGASFLIALIPILSIGMIDLKVIFVSMAILGTLI